MRRGKSAYSREAIPNQGVRVSKKKWYRILSILRSMVISIIGSKGMFRRLNHALKTADARKVGLTAHIHNELNLWWNFIDSLGDRPTHIREIRMTPPPPTWTGMIDA